MIMSSDNLKMYEFDKKLDTKDIQYIDRFEINMMLQEIRCDRCNACLKYINELRIKEDHFNIGDFCYGSILDILVKLWKQDRFFVQVKLEQGYTEYLRKKHEAERIARGSIDKHDKDYSLYLTLKWDAEHNSLPEFNRKEYERLRKKFNS